MRTLKEKLSASELMTQSLKSDLEKERNDLQNKLINSTEQFQQARANSKVLEDKLKYSEIEREKLEAKYEERIKELSSSKQDIEQSFKKANQELQEKLRELERESSKKIVYLEKELALS